jgi:hypothetical protein
VADESPVTWVERINDTARSERPGHCHQDGWQHLLWDMVEKPEKTNCIKTVFRKGISLCRNVNDIE